VRELGLGHLRNPLPAHEKLLYRACALRIVGLPMITTLTLAAGLLAVVAAVATVLTRVLGHGRGNRGGDPSVRDLGPVSQRWLSGHRTEPL